MRISDWSSDVCSSDLLDAMAPQLVGRDGDGDGSLWTGLRRELGELFVVRAAGTKSPRASERLDRARRYLSAGQADQSSEERRVGKECVRKCRSRWSPYT